MPNVVGDPVHQAKAILAGQPLAATLVYRPAEPRQRVGVVVKQFPGSGYLSSGSRVTLVLPKALHGVVPHVVGMTVERAQARLERLNLDVTISPDGASGSARVLAQSPRAGRAAAPGMGVRLFARRG